MRAPVSFAAASALCVALGIVACRDAAEPFRPVDREPSGDASRLRLTYGSGDDRVPAWSADGRAVYFVTSSWEANPLAPRTILSLAADGMGAASPLLANVQLGTDRSAWIDAPAVSPDGDRIAFVHVPPLLPAEPCVGTRVCPVMSNLPMVRLTRAALHVRAIDATSDPDDDDILPLAFEGHEMRTDTAFPHGFLTISDYHPFQYLFETEALPFFRPSWSPAGTELVVSDGLRLLRWIPASDALEPIAGTADGISPAWSPTGEWIAFTRHPRVDSATYACEYQNVYDPDVGPTTDCVEQRTTYETAAPEIVLVRPDGSELRVLGTGVDPAWSPDGAFVYAGDWSGTGMIGRIDVEGGVSEVIAGTERGIEPAVSPDGSRLAFARGEQLELTIAHDVWVVQLP